MPVAAEDATSRPSAGLPSPPSSSIVPPLTPVQGRIDRDALCETVQSPRLPQADGRPAEAGKPSAGSRSTIRSSPGSSRGDIFFQQYVVLGFRYDRRVAPASLLRLETQRAEKGAASPLGPRAPRPRGEKERSGGRGAPAARAAEPRRSSECACLDRHTVLHGQVARPARGLPDAVPRDLRRVADPGDPYLAVERTIGLAASMVDAVRGARIRNRFSTGTAEQRATVQPPRRSELERGAPGEEDFSQRRRGEALSRARVPHLAPVPRRGGRREATGRRRRRPGSRSATVTRSSRWGTTAKTRGLTLVDGATCGRARRRAAPRQAHRPCAHRGHARRRQLGAEPRRRHADLRLAALPELGDRDAPALSDDPSRALRGLTSSCASRTSRGGRLHRQLFATFCQQRASSQWDAKRRCPRCVGGVGPRRAAFASSPSSASTRPCRGPFRVVVEEHVDVASLA